MIFPRETGGKGSGTKKMPGPPGKGAVAHQSTMATLKERVGQHADDLNRDWPAGDRRHSLERFQFLVFAVTHYAIEAGDVAARLGVGLAAVTGWPLGTYIPENRAERGRIMLAVRVMLADELEKADEMSGTPAARSRLSVHGLPAQA